MSRRVVITGGATGLGARMAERFAELGDRVAVCDADRKSLDDFAEANPSIMVRVADVRDEAAMDAFLGEVEAEWGGADVVCANAGIGGPAGRIEDIGYQDWQDTVAVSLFGSYLTCRWAARVMRAQGSGVLILTSSTAGQWGLPHRTPYSAAKWGVIGLMKTLAMELGPAGVRVNAICPGAVEGERMERVLANEAAVSGRDIEEVRRKFTSVSSMGTWVTSDDIAETVLWLASDAAARVSGQAIAIDGHTETSRS